MAARAGFEAAIKAAWLVDADDPFDREARWLAHLSSQERYLSRSANELSEAEQNATVSPQVREVRLARAEQLRKWEASVRDFRLKIAEMLPPDVVRLKGIPTFKDMLASLGGQKLYSLYVYLSQTAHAEHNATWLYRTGGLGTKKRIGEFVSPSDWGGPLRTSFLNFAHPCRIFFARLGGNPDGFLDADTHRMVEDAIEAIGTEISRRLPTNCARRSCDISRCSSMAVLSTSTHCPCRSGEWRISGGAALFGGLCQSVPRAEMRLCQTVPASISAKASV
jgi:hypothetical protein